MIRLSDYFFYRIFIFFKNRNDSVANTSALSILSLVEFCTLLDIMTLAQIIFDFPNPPKQYALITIVILLSLNLNRYQSKLMVEKISNQWANEKTDFNKRNDWLLAVYLIISIFGGLVYKLS